MLNWRSLDCCLPLSSCSSRWVQHNFGRDLKAGIAELKSDLLKVTLGIAVAIILANATLTFGMLRLLLR